MADLIFHIGHPKTGTTALQSVLTANAQNLLRHGVLYPIESDPGYHKHILAKPYLTGTENPTLHRRTGHMGEPLLKLSKAYFGRLQKEVASHPHRKLVLSCEGYFCVPKTKEFRSRLGELCESVKVVAYLRSPGHRVLSQLNQNIRMMRRFHLPPAEFFRPVLQSYLDGGFTDLSLNLFDRGQLRDGSIVADFSAKYLPPDLPPLTTDQGERPNESVSGEALVILSELSQRWNIPDGYAQDPRRPKAVALLREADMTVGGNRRPSLRPEIAAALAARSTDLPWLRDTYGIAFSDVDYDSIGKPLAVDFTTLKGVEDYCLIDHDRLAALRTATDEGLKRIGRGGLKGWLWGKLSG